MATVRARALSLGVLLILALCLSASAAERQPTNRYISYAGLPRTGGRKASGAPRGSGHSVLKGCKDCHGQPPMTTAAKTAAAEPESKGTVDIGAGVPRGNVRNLISASAAGRCKDCHGEPPTKAAAEITVAGSKGTDISPAATTMTGAKTAAAAVTGAKMAAAGSEGAYISHAALSEEKARYISYAALKHNQPHAKCPRRSCA